MTLGPKARLTVTYLCHIDAAPATLPFLPLAYFCSSSSIHQLLRFFNVDSTRDDTCGRALTVDALIGRVSLDMMLQQPSIDLLQGSIWITATALEKVLDLSWCEGVGWDLISELAWHIFPYQPW